MPIPGQSSAQASVIASLFIQAVRQGQSLWFRVISGSMQPTLRVGDTVFVLPAKANEIQPGEIAAFETPDGLVIHRIVQRQQIDSHVRLLEMGDVALRASWIEESAIVGKVILIRHGSQQIDLQYPIAKRCGVVTAYLRYTLFQYYTKQKVNLLRVVMHKCSRLAARVSYQCICRSSASHKFVSEETVNVAEE